MSDLWIAIGVMLTLSLIAGTAAALLVGSANRQRQMLVIALAATGSFAFLFYAAGRLYWAVWIPDTAVIVWSNLTPILSAVAAGCCWQLAQTPRWRRILFGSSMTLATVAATFWPFLGLALRPPPAGGNVWAGGVAMQTSWATCSPAAAATFLAAGGIETSESYLVPRCLTDGSGTPTLGLFRGVKLVANQSQRDVVAIKMAIADLLSNDNWPVLLMVKLPRDGVSDSRYEEQWGWIPGMGHSVVALGRDTSGRIVIGDPAKGLEAWTETDLRVLWHGDAIRFTDRDPR